MVALLNGIAEQADIRELSLERPGMRLHLVR
jgi:hypothetical protein